MAAPVRPAPPADRDEGRACPLDMNRRLLNGFLDRLQAEACFSPTDGCFDLQRLRDLADAYLAETTIAAQAPGECLRLHDAVLWEDRRHKPFERLMARRFSSMLPKRAGDEGGPAPEARLSRRLIPGLMTALAMMVGRETMEEAGARAARQLARHREAKLGLVDWPALESEAETRVLVSDVLVRCAGHFQPFGRRLEWLTMVINSQLPPPLPEDHDPAWRCTPERARLLLGALYAPLRTDLAADAGATLTARHGEAAVADLTRLLDALEG